MPLTVLLFASYADALGTSMLELDLPTPIVLGDLLAHIRSLPGAERLPPKPLVAVNQRYARGDHLIDAGDEVAVIPPVAGG